MYELAFVDARLERHDRRPAAERLTLAIGDTSIAKRWGGDPRPPGIDPASLDFSGHFTAAPK